MQLGRGRLGWRVTAATAAVVMAGGAVAAVLISLL
jgi:hypothetical protein